MTTKLLKLSQIVTTAGTQIRASIDEATVAQYAEAMLDSANKFPPVIVFHDGSQHVLADGFHRVMAANRNDFLDIEADVRKGTVEDALLFALSANAAHGLKRSNADKRRSVELAIAKWPKRSNREIASICAVSDMMVADVKGDQVQDSCTSETVTGKDGKQYPASPKRNGSKNATAAETSTESAQPSSTEQSSSAESAAPEPEAPAEPYDVKRDENLRSEFANETSAIKLAICCWSWISLNYKGRHGLLWAVRTIHLATGYWLKNGKE